MSPHVDRLPLVSSAIINVAQDVDEPWPLEVIGHDGKAENVTMVRVLRRRRPLFFLLEARMNIDCCSSGSRLGDSQIIIHITFSFDPGTRRHGFV